MHYGIPAKIMNMIKLLYENFTCHVINGGTVRVTTGVRQGCLFSPLLFIILLDWISKTAFKDPKTIMWTLKSFLEDLEFADGICNLSH